MNRIPAVREKQAFTLLELLVVIGVVALLVSLLIPVNRSPKRGSKVVCMSNLKQSALGVLVWASDHGGRFPWEVSTNRAGTQEWIESGSPVDQLQSLRSFGLKPAQLKCPSDSMKVPAQTFDRLSASNVSYFVNADASTSNNPAKGIVFGDRHLQANGKPVVPGMFRLAGDLEMSWTRELHPAGGNLAFADGHVEFVKAQRLQEVIQQLPQATNRFLIP